MPKKSAITLKSAVEDADPGATTFVRCDDDLCNAIAIEVAGCDIDSAGK